MGNAANIPIAAELTCTRNAAPRDRDNIQARDKTSDSICHLLVDRSFKTDWMAQTILIFLLYKVNETDGKYLAIIASSIKQCKYDFRTQNSWLN